MDVFEAMPQQRNRRRKIAILNVGVEDIPQHADVIGRIAEGKKFQHIRRAVQMADFVAVERFQH